MTAPARDPETGAPPTAPAGSGRPVPAGSPGPIRAARVLTLLVGVAGALAAPDRARWLRAAAATVAGVEVGWRLAGMVRHPAERPTPRFDRHPDELRLWVAAGDTHPARHPAPGPS
ncbi:hypothetical protein [Micromonospora auratinigra]|uniref:Uncharacterized protein n=1 Tax=Micromonospora auratinigra TaxID=261654 RepID=A0A1A8ZPN1_9ACTN|nr:hypothetical protein [Micromonospora auratinigra]SBT46068.1 hypothetical protein GA0070611_3247 [Micromonospora auratinigra]